MRRWQRWKVRQGVVRPITICLFVVVLALQADTNTFKGLENTALNLGRKNFLDLCKEFQQPCLEYEVITEDGYILTVHRIRGDETRPVLLWHGFLGSSDDYILRGADSTGAALAAAGHDVWIGNSRGNKYSRKHINLHPDTDRKYWDFSFHEMGLYDMPAVINYILYRSGLKKLSAIGHSLGTTMFYILASREPIYNDIVQPFISMAPVAFLTNIRPLFRDILPLWPPISTDLQLSGVYEVFQDEVAGKKMVQLLCSQGGEGKKLCEDDGVISLAGNVTGEIEQGFYGVISEHFPAGTSTKYISHLVQIYLKNSFSAFDDGSGAAERVNPEYDLRRVTTEVALLCGAGDDISTLEDVKLLRTKLPNVVYYKILDQFNHIDFIWGRNINNKINPVLKTLLNKFS